MKIYMSVILVFVLVVFNSNQAQEIGQIGASLKASYSVPVAGLSEWFKPALNYGLAIGQQTNENWFVEGEIEYARFNEENLSGYAAEHVEMSLEHTGLLVNGKYTFGTTSFLKTFLNLGGGIYYWKGIRGQIEADSLMTPAIPFIDQKVLEEWNWGFKAGLGMEFMINKNISCDLVGYYRFIVGDLWPTLQPHILLENVSGFQTVNFSLNVRYYFVE